MPNKAKAGLSGRMGKELPIYTARALGGGVHRGTLRRRMPNKANRDLQRPIMRVSCCHVAGELLSYRVVISADILYQVAEFCSSSTVQEVSLRARNGNGGLVFEGGTS